MSETPIISQPPRRPALGILVKLLALFIVIGVIFVGTITVILHRTQALERLASGIVSQNYRVVEYSGRMSGQLISLLDYAKRYKILNKEEYRLVYLDNLVLYEKDLHELVELRVVPGPWKELHQDLLANLPAAMSSGGRLRIPEALTKALPEQEQSEQAIQTSAYAVDVPFLPEEAVNDWLTTLAKAREDNEKMMYERLVSLGGQAARSERVALMGAFATIAVGVLGLSLFAYTVNRSLRELRRGINRLADGDLSGRVAVRARDEFGQLGEAFNHMSVRLKREEELRSDFISMLSHEIRTPLTSIRESVNLVRQGVLGDTTERQRHFLEIAGREAQRLSNLLSKLMDVSSLEAGEMHLEVAELDPVQLLKGTIERIEPSAMAKNVDIVLHAPENGLMVQADAEHVRQALLNLLGNAIKFSPEGTDVNVYVDMEDGEAVFRVADSGPGIPEDEQAYVFHKYYRAKGVRKFVDGAGLGLSISKHIVEAHGGRMWLASTPGQGSTFCFTLPSHGQSG